MSNKPTAARNASKGLWRRSLTGTLATTLALLACHSSHNIIGLTVPSDHKEAYDVQLALGQAYYDRGDYDVALEHGEKAWDLNPNSESVAVLLGYVYLAKAGITPFGLAKRLNEQEESSKTSESEASEDEQTDSDEQTDGDGTGTGDALAALGDVVVLSDEDLGQMGSFNLDDPELPILLPVCAGEARERVETLRYLNLAISTICSFVDTEVKISQDARHACEQNPQLRQRRAESHLLWAFAHLSEAIAFYQVLNYNTNGSDKSNLEKRVDSLENLEVSTAADITNLVAQVDSVAAMVDAILPTTGECKPGYPDTQLVAMINGLMATSAAFKRLPGIPERMINSVNKSIERVQGIREQTTEGFESKEQQANAAKGDLTKEISSVVSEAIAGADASSFSTEQADAVCTSYRSILGDTGSDSTETIPELCQ